MQQNNDWITVLAAVIPVCLTAYTLASSWIKAWERVQEKRDAEHINAVVANHFRSKIDEFKETYTDILQMFKSGTFK